MKTIRNMVGAGVLALNTMGCLGAMDMLGAEEAVSEKREIIGDDDADSDTEPTYDEYRWVVESFDEYCRLEVNKSATITELDILPLEGEDAEFAHHLYPGRREAATAVLNKLDGENSLLPSMEVVNGALKPFNDGLYASIEEGVQNGWMPADGVSFPSKRVLLQQMLDELTALLPEVGAAGANYVQAAMIHLTAALQLSGTAVTIEDGLQAEVTRQVNAFQDNTLFSRPIGFYTWTDTLQQVFQQDRFLQNYQGESAPFSDNEVGQFTAMALVLNHNAALLEDYERIISVYARLTNPFWDYPLTALLPYATDASVLNDVDSIAQQFLVDHDAVDSQACGPHFAVFPASKTKETTYFESLYCSVETSLDNVNYMQTFIDGIQSGAVDLTPTTDSGWYDYQTYALETLLLPERAPESIHLRLTEAYKEKLRETFTSILIQNRETHVKQSAIGVSVGAESMKPMDVYPLFRAEPFPEFYLRNARAYRFLHTWLTTIMGESFMNERGRLTDDGAGMSNVSLAEELRSHAELLYGLYFITADNIGMAPSLLTEEMLEFDEAACRARASNWVDSWMSDTDINRDMRVILPVQRDLRTNETIYWAVMGVKVVKAKAEFMEGYEPDVRTCFYDNDDCAESYCVPGEFAAHNYYMLVEQSAEFRLPSHVAPPTREEFRTICDSSENMDDILVALQNM